jgi:formiminotetrahydrofolate cyclodeaminase
VAATSAALARRDDDTANGALRENPVVLSLPVDELLDEFARATPVPGAGPAAAFVTATAAALTAMAARSSRDAWADAGAVAAQAESLRARAVRLAQEDADALNAVLSERAGAEDREEVRNFRLGRSLHRAADVPLAIAEVASDVAQLAAHTADRCVGDVRADATSGALLASGAARAAAHLVEVNLATVAGDARVTRARSLVRAAEAAANEAARKAAEL